MKADERTDFLIIGQGLAGTLLGRAFEARGISFRIIDRARPVAASRVAAGLVHPVTGRRHARSWMLETFLNFNRDYYAALHRLAGREFYHEVPGLEIAATTKDVNDWIARMDDPDLRLLLDGPVSKTEYAEPLQPAAGLFTLRGCGWMDLPALLDHYRSKWTEGGQMFVDDYRPEELVVSSESIKYQHLTSRAIVFCEGAQARQNPLWSWLPFDPAKGEILTIRVPDLPEQHILFRGGFLVPLGGHRFKAGATYSWHRLDAEPTEAGREELKQKIASVIRVPYEILDHQAGVRPAVKGRRPLIGRHPVHPNVYLLNGFGSKGVLMGPWLTENFVEWMNGKGSLPPEADIERHASGYPA